jgi:septum formation protein
MAGEVVRPRVVLASASPRRRQLLTLVGIPHDVQPADLDETVRADEDPAAYVERLSRAKASASGDAEAVTIGSDTTVVVDGAILAKPESPADAARMLRQLAGRSHEVLTGVAVAWHGQVESGVERVSVTFRDLTDEEIACYVATGEPMDKAGAYGIQGFGATLVTRVDGDYFAVMGLPVNRMVRLLERLGLRYRFGALEAVADSAG